MSEGDEEDVEVVVKSEGEGTEEEGENKGCGGDEVFEDEGREAEGDDLNTSVG